jgi:DNA topoisomerase-6 subunit B
VNLVSTYVPYTSAGKQSVADMEEVTKEIKFALMDACRKFQRYHSKKRRDIEREARLNTLLKYATELAPSISKVTGSDEKKLLVRLEDLIRKRLKYEMLHEEEAEEEEAPAENGGVSEEEEK